MNRYGLLGLSLVGVLGAACSNSTSGGSGPIPLSDITTTLAAKLCEAVFECPGTEDVRAIRILAGSVSECSTTFGANFANEADITEQIAQVNSGEYTYDGARARECVNAMGCNLIGGGVEPPACRYVFQGTVAEGGECNDSADCAGEDMYCHAETPGTCPGTCTAAVAQGASCRSSRDCSTVGGTISPYCHFSDSPTGTCKEGRASSVGSGEACGQIATATTVTMASCGEGFFCQLARTGDTNVGTCAAVLADGATCESTEQCPETSLCMGGTCGAPPVANTAGAACANSDAGPFCNPLRRLVCNASNVCEAIPGTGQVGEGCTAGDFSVSCATGNYCDDETDLCVAKKAIGATCQGSDECVSGSCSFGSGGTGMCSEANTCHI